MTQIDDSDTRETFTIAAGQRESEAQIDRHLALNDANRQGRSGTGATVLPLKLTVASRAGLSRRGSTS